MATIEQQLQNIIGQQVFQIAGLTVALEAAQARVKELEPTPKPKLAKPGSKPDGDK